MGQTELVLRMARQLYPDRASVTFSTQLQDWVWNHGWPSGVSGSVTIDLEGGAVHGSLEAAGRRLAEEHTRRAIAQGGRDLSEDWWKRFGTLPDESDDPRERGYVPEWARSKV